MKHKSKTTAVVLAVLFGYWSWLYTKNDNLWKFWLGILLSLFFFWTIIVPFGIYIWAIIDNAVQPTEYYQKYKR